MKMVLALVLAGALGPFGGSGYRNNEKGNRLYEAGDFEDALRAYTEAQVDLPEAPELFYDIGNVLYRRGDLEGAEEAWLRAMSGSDGELLADAAHNLGNARFQRQAFGEAVDAYRRALEVRPDDRDTKRNLELALRRLQAQQQQQERPQQQQQDQEQDPQDQQEEPREPRQNPGDQEEPKRSGNEDRREDGSMTREEAERLLDSLEDGERDNLKEEEERKAAAAGSGREKDW